MMERAAVMDEIEKITNTRKEKFESSNVVKEAGLAHSAKKTEKKARNTQENLRSLNVGAQVKVTKVASEGKKVQKNASKNRTNAGSVMDKKIWNTSKNVTQFDEGGRKGPDGRSNDPTGHGGQSKTKRNTGAKVHKQSRGLFGIAYEKIDCPLQTSTKAECTVRGGEPGVWVCRTLYDVVTGKPYNFSTCIDVVESLGRGNDTCGCCGECTTVCSCPCDDGVGTQGYVKVLELANPEDGSQCVSPKRAAKMVSNAGLLGPLHVCDESCK